MELKQMTVRAMEDLDEAALMDCVEKLHEEGIDCRQLGTLLQEGMKGVGKKFEAGEYFLADLIMSGELFKDIMEKVCQEQEQGMPEESLGVVLLGVMEGDIHDIGKDIVRQTLQTEGFRVIDLGVDVAPEIFLEAALKYQPDIIALSGVMGFCVDKMQKIITLLKENGIRDKVKVVVGGSCMNQELYKFLEADGYTDGPMENVALCKKIMEKRNHDE